ncbi:MAG: hypothetical protein M3Y27_30505, partial [Acidobacteriota bacterium]|nr:hypothetical protein [Acidobacteriota bacterium]
ILDRAAAAIERIKDVLLLVRRDTRTPVSNTDLYRRPLFIMDKAGKYANPVVSLGPIFKGILQ